MGIAEIVGFAFCWTFVATLMLWGVFTENRRGGVRVPRIAEPWYSHLPNRPGAPPQEWTLVETACGSGPEVIEQARFFVAAWLATRGIDIADLAAGDLRTEVVSTDGDTFTRVLVRTTALNRPRSRRRR